MAKALKMINTSSILVEIHESQIVDISIAKTSHRIQRDVLIKHGCIPFHDKSFPIFPQRVWRRKV